jgi:hypothetical protein
MVMVYVPILRGEDFDGLILGIFSVQPSLDTILDEKLGDGYSIAFRTG